MGILGGVPVVCQQVTPLAPSAAVLRHADTVVPPGQHPIQVKHTFVARSHADTYLQETFEYEEVGRDSQSRVVPLWRHFPEAYRDVTAVRATQGFELVCKCHAPFRISLAKFRGLPPGKAVLGLDGGVKPLGATQGAIGSGGRRRVTEAGGA